MAIRTCRKCKETKDLSTFYKASNGNETLCKNCRNAQRRAAYAAMPTDKKEEFKEKERLRLWERNLKTKYGVTVGLFQKILNSQNGRCAICGTTECFHPQLSVDHDHITGAVRGLLCGKCNRGMGDLQDSINILEAAIDYLKNAKDWRQQ